MKTRTITMLFALVMIVPCFIHAQTGAVNWSALDAGFAVASAGNSRVTLVLGQTFAGTASAANEGIKSGFLAYPFRPSLSSGVQATGTAGLPTSYDLSQNYPNPFNPKTVVRSQVPEVSEVRLVIFDLLGREVKVLVNERRAAGYYEDSFDGSGLASGVYIYRMTAGSFVQTRKMILLK